MLSHKVVGQLAPVQVGVSHVVGVEVTRGTAEFHRDGRAAQQLQLLVQAVGEDLYLLAQTCGRGGLTMCLGQHGHVLPLLGILGELSNELLDERIIDLLHRFLDAQGHTCVVDVLTGETEVDELLVFVE